MKKVTIFLAFLFLLVNISFALNSDMSIYIRNQPYKGVYVIKNDSLYIPLNVFFKCIKYDWIQKDKQVYILDYRLDNPSPEIVGQNLTYYFGDENFTVDSFVKDGKLFINANALAKKMEMYVMYNDQTNIFDIVMPNQNAAQVTSVAPVSSSGSAGGSSTDNKEPIVADLQTYQDYTPTNQAAGGDIRGTLNVKNTGSKEVTGIAVTVYIETQDGEPLNQQQFAIGTLAAGQEVTKDYYWSNPNPMLAIKSKTEVKHDPIPEDKKEEKTETLTPTTTLEPGAGQGTVK